MSVMLYTIGSVRMPERILRPTGLEHFTSKAHCFAGLDGIIIAYRPGLAGSDACPFEPLASRRKQGNIAREAGLRDFSGDPNDIQMPVDFLPADPSLGFFGHAFSLERGNFLRTKSTERLSYATTDITVTPTATSSPDANCSSPGK